MKNSDTVNIYFKLLRKVRPDQRKKGRTRQPYLTRVLVLLQDVLRLDPLRVLSEEYIEWTTEQTPLK